MIGQYRTQNQNNCIQWYCVLNSQLGMGQDLMRWWIQAPPETVYWMSSAVWYSVLFFQNCINIISQELSGNTSRNDCKTFTPQTFTTPDVHHPRHSPPQTFTTSDIHHPRRSPPPILKCDIHQGCLDCRNILNAWTVGEFSFGGDDCRGWGMLVGGFFFLASNAQEHIYSKT